MHRSADGRLLSARLWKDRSPRRDLAGILTTPLYCRDSRGVRHWALRTKVLEKLNFVVFTKRCIHPCNTDVRQGLQRATAGGSEEGVTQGHRALGDLLVSENLPEGPGGGGAQADFR